MSSVCFGCASGVFSGRFRYALGTVAGAPEARACARLSGFTMRPSRGCCVVAFRSASRVREQNPQKPRGLIRLQQNRLRSNPVFRRRARVFVSLPPVISSHRRRPQPRRPERSTVASTVGIRLGKARGPGSGRTTPTSSVARRTSNNHSGSPYAGNWVACCFETRGRLRAGHGCRVPIFSHGDLSWRYYPRRSSDVA